MSKKLETINIKGKEYVTVNERLKYFRENFKDWRLLTDVIELTEKRVVLKASILNPKGEIVANGLSCEIAGSSFINKTSHIENCFHKDTEILTLRGWRKISEVSKKEKIAQVDLFDNNKITFSKPLEKIEAFSDLIKIEDNLTCQVVTPKHDVIIDGVKIKAIDLYNQFHDKKKTLNIENKAFKDCRDNKINKESIEYIQLLNWIISDGHIDYKKYCHIKFGFKKKRKFERLKKILGFLPIDFSHSYNSSNEIYRINIKGEYGKEIVKNYLPVKSLTFDLAKNMSQEQGEAFIEEFQYTDGTLNSRDGIYLRQKDKLLFQSCNFLAMRCGYDVCSPKETINSTNFTKRPTEFYRVVYKKEAKRNSTKFEKIKGFHKVYCFTMPKGNLITRYNHKITISGNCETSAWGRALGNMGIGVDSSVCSADEVANAIIQQNKAPLRKVVKQMKQEPFGTEQEIQATFIKLKDDLESCETLESLGLCFGNKKFQEDLKKLDIARKELIIGSKEAMKGKLK